MFITKTSLSRRTVLRGLGATLSLPLLEAMVPAMTATVKTAAAPTKRFGAVFVPMGERPSHWTPDHDRRQLRVQPNPQADRIVPRLDHRRFEHRPPPQARTP